jgi:hypothetical protein
MISACLMIPPLHAFAAQNFIVSSAKVGDIDNTVFEQSAPFGQGLSPRNALGSSATTPLSPRRLRRQEMEVISACVNSPNAENSTPASLSPVRVGKVMLPIAESVSASMMVSTNAARNAEREREAYDRDKSSDFRSHVRSPSGQFRSDSFGFFCDASATQQSANIVD